MALPLKIVQASKYKAKVTYGRSLSCDLTSMNIAASHVNQKMRHVHNPKAKGEKFQSRTGIEDSTIWDYSAFVNNILGKYVFIQHRNSATSLVNNPREMKFNLAPEETGLPWDYETQWEGFSVTQAQQSDYDKSFVVPGIGLVPVSL